MAQKSIFHVKKNDVVQVMVGKDKGKTGKILRVIHKSGKVVVEKVNIIKKHRKANGKQPGGIIEAEAPISASNVLIYADGAKKGVRTSYKFLDKGKKVRVNPKLNLQLDK